MVIQPAEHYLVTAKILLGDIFGGAKEEAWIELRELSALELARFQKVVAGGDEEKNIQVFTDLLPKIIVDHNLMRDETAKLTTEEIRGLLEAKADACFRAIKEFSEQVLFSQGRKISEG